MNDSVFHPSCLDRFCRMIHPCRRKLFQPKHCRGTCGHKRKTCWSRHLSPHQWVGASTSNTWKLGHSKKDWEDSSKASGISPDHPLQLGSLQEAKQNSKGCCAHAPSELPTVWPTGSSNCDATPQGSKVAQQRMLVTLWVDFKENPWIMHDLGTSLWTLWTAHDNRESSICFLVRSRRCAKEIAAMRRGWVTALARLKLPGDP